MADYGKLNVLAKSRININLVPPEWDDILRLLASLKLRKSPAEGIMRTLQVADKPTRLAKAISEIGRIDKTIHMSIIFMMESFPSSDFGTVKFRRGRHSLGRSVFMVNRENFINGIVQVKEDQLGALGLVLNIITFGTLILWMLPLISTTRIASPYTMKM